MRFVFDNNVIVSALLLPRSLPRQAFDKAIDEGTMLASIPVIVELAEILHRPKFNKYLLEDERMRFIVELLAHVELIRIAGVVTSCRDPNDNKFLELAVEGKASCIVSGDDDLLVLNPFRDIPIVTPREFLRRFSWDKALANPN